jgi:hypothetical protein
MHRSSAMSYHLRDAVFSAFNQKRQAKWRR